jgi:hypothetical protein
MESNSVLNVYGNKVGGENYVKIFIFKNPKY